MDSPRVLIVEDESIVAEDLAMSLRAMGYRVEAILATGEDAVAWVEAHRSDLVLMDVMLKGTIDGIEAGNQIRSRFRVPLVYLTAYSDESILTRAKTTAPQGYLLKPFQDRELRAVIEVALHNHALEERARESEERFRNLFEGAPQAICLTDPETGILIDANQATAELFGIEREKLLGTSQAGLHREEERKRFEDALAQAKANQEVSLHEGVVVRGDRTEIPVEIQIQRIWLHGRSVLHSAYRDISIRKKALEELERSKDFLQSVINAATDSIMVIGRDFGIRLMNEAARAKGGAARNEEEPLRCFAVSHGSHEVCSGQDHPCPLKRVLETGKPFTVIHTHVRSDGTQIPFELTASPLFDREGSVTGIIEVGRDISERIALEDEKRKLAERKFLDEKERSLVTIAGGMAHDFNNLLTSVVGNAELLKVRLPAGEREERLLEQITRSATKMAELTRQLLAYAKRGRYQPEIAFANRLVAEALELCENGRSEDVNVRLSLAKEPWHVFADRQQFHRMLANIFRNAFEAMEGTRGELRIAVENVEQAEAWECPHGHVHNAGEYVSVEVSDTGPGIPISERQRIFEPFYTTHFFGRGLGLSAALGIVQNHGGCITVGSGGERGACFRILLPRVKEPAALAGPFYASTRLPPLASAPAEQKGIVRPKGARVLVVDDETSVLELVREALEVHGLDVVCVESGENGITAFRQEPQAYCAVLLDVQLKDMDGKNVYRELKALRAEVPVFLASGFDEEIALGPLRLSSPDCFLQKPFQLNALVERIRALAR